MSEDKETLDDLLKLIEEKRGAYSRDHLKHAENCINAASENAKKIREELFRRLRHMIREAENDEIGDVRHGLYSLFRDLGGKVAKDPFGDFYLEEDENGQTNEKTEEEVST